MWRDFLQHMAQTATELKFKQTNKFVMISHIVRDTNDIVK